MRAFSVFLPIFVILMGVSTAQAGWIGKGGKPTEEKALSPDEALKKFTTNLTEKFQQPGQEIEPFVGREDILEQAENVLNRSKAGNVLLIGEDGAGKNAIVNELALQLPRRQLLELDTSTLLAGTSYRGDLENHFRNLLDAITKSPHHYVLVIPRVHILFQETSLEPIARELSQMMTRGQISVIGTTTPGDLNQFMANKSFFTSSAEVIQVPNLTPDELMDVLRARKEQLEKTYDVKLTDKALTTAVRMVPQYFPNEPLSDKAIAIIEGAMKRESNRAIHGEKEDRATKQKRERLQREQASLQKDLAAGHLTGVDLQEARARLEDISRQLAQIPAPQEDPRVTQLKKNLREAEAEYKNHIQMGNTQKAGELKFGLIPQLKRQIAELLPARAGAPAGALAVVDELAIEKHIGRVSGRDTALDRMDPSERLEKLREGLNARVIGQPEAVDAIVKSMKKRLAGVNPRQGGNGYLLMGPTGVGKTELTKALAAEWFQNPEAIVRIDMGGYKESFSASTLMSPPKGYQGATEGGVLTEGVRKKPFSIVVFDEIEKAHNDVHDYLYSILAEGRGTDGAGRETSFRHNIMIGTSNLAEEYALNKEFLTSEQIEKLYGVSEAEQKALSPAELDQQVMRNILRRADWADAFINRWRLILVRKLTLNEVAQIARILIKEQAKYLYENKGITLKYDDAVVRALAQAGFDEQMGARPLIRAHDDIITDMLEDFVLDSKAQKGDVIELRFEAGADGRGGHLIGTLVDGETKARDVFFRAQAKAEAAAATAEAQVRQQSLEETKTNPARKAVKTGVKAADR